MTAGSSAGVELTFDITEIPFARRGSWFDLSPVTGPHERSDQVHLVSHQTGMHAILGIVPWRDGHEAAARIQASPYMLRWACDGGEVEAVFDGDDTVRMRGRGVGVRLTDALAELTPFTGAFVITDPVDGAAVLTSYESGRRYRVTMLRGTRRVIGDGALGRATRAIEVDAAAGAAGVGTAAAGAGAAGDAAGAADAVADATTDGWELAIEEFGTARPAYRPRLSFDECVAEVRADFDEYARALAPWATADADPTRAATARKAAYVLWSATVRPAGFLGREAVLMSKHWMDKVWSWDHCFTALALAGAHPDAALDQFLLPFDHQDPSGALPDSITHSELLYNYVKPPIHGWALRQLRQRMRRPIPADTLRTIYDRLSRWTRFWLDARRAPGSILPYYQHGNDSGWDNATTFDADRVIVAPDLAAFLVIQLRVLDELGDELAVGATEWRALADRIEDALYATLWTGDRFIARSAAVAERVPTEAAGDAGAEAMSAAGEPAGGSSLLTALPILLGERLRPGVAAALAESLTGFLTEWGLATEPVDSAAYASDGYWRGPIWAPSTALVEDGARRAGLVELADTVRERFLRLCEHGGFAENFDAVTGEGLRDRAYTWTAGVYLTLAADAADAGGRA